MTDLKFGFFLPHVPSPGLETLALKADVAGFDFICCDDHLMSPFSSMAPDFEGCYEAWTTMAYLAGKTKSVKLSHMVLVPTFRGPAVLARMASTLDVLSGGRLILTTGAGWFQKEFEAYHIPWEGHKERIGREREALQIIRALWTEDVVTFHGKYYSLTEADSFPRPLQKPCPPIWVGGDSKQSMNVAAELGDGWLMHGHYPEEVDRMIARMRPLLGQKADDFVFGTALFALMGPTREKADEKLRKVIPEKTWNDFMNADIRKEIKHRISGPPQDFVGRLRQYQAAGVNRIILIFLDPADVDLFVKEVLPEFRNTGG
jgi:alkanesulfonate monooxygenase SsuD/methylene tetrahydromethanopterin reductase-like flavin-dependent oxidoreductase (luciferase family)